MSKAFSKTRRNLVFDKYLGRCAYCGTCVSLADMHVDHITPKKMGGDNTVQNLNPSCNRCNTSKGDRNIEEFRLQKMISASCFNSIINFKQWQSLNELGVVINLPVHNFYFEEQGDEQSRNRLGLEP